MSLDSAPLLVVEIGGWERRGAKGTMERAGLPWVASEFQPSKSGVNVLMLSWAGTIISLPSSCRLIRELESKIIETLREVTAATTLWIWKGNPDHQEMPKGLLNPTQSRPVFLVARAEAQREQRAPSCTRLLPESLDALSLSAPP